MKTIKTILIFSVIAALLALSFTGCAKKDKADGKKLSIAMVTDVGGVNDQSFNQSAWEGLQKAAKELGIKVSYIESNQPADYATNMETLLDSGNDLIWGIGFLMGDSVLAESKANPEQKYAIIDVNYEANGVKIPKNVVCAVFREEEPSFLVGYIAGKMTKTGKIGFVGGIKFALIEKFEYGFMAGAKMANPKVEIFSQYAESFTDAAKGKAIASSMYQSGADIVFHASGGVGDGVIEAAKERGMWAIGVDKDQRFMAPDNVLTSAMKLVGNAIYNVGAAMVDGKFAGGTAVVYGLKEGGVGLPAENPNVPANILDEAKDIERKIIAGEIKVPATMAEYTEFIKKYLGK